MGRLSSSFLITIDGGLSSLVGPYRLNVGVAREWCVVLASSSACVRPIGSSVNL